MIYYASKISGNMAKTPEGFLLCQNVPIARVGKQDYMASELPIEGVEPTEIITVYRASKDVFSTAAMASFEGKPVTNEHPSNMLDPRNITDKIKGVAQNIRRDKQYLVADLLIYDAQLIQLIENGKREVSCGYNASYEKRNGGKLYQVSIEGNHIAVVSSGRAGDKVAIKDSNQQNTPQWGKTERRNDMSKKTKSRNKGVAGALANIFPYFHADNQPAEVAEALEELVEAVKEEYEVAEEHANDDIPTGYESYHKLIYDMF